MLTKGTGIPFVAGLLVWYAIECVRRRGFRRTVVENAPAILIVVLVNGPFWYRNIATYGGPYGADLPLSLPSEGGSGPPSDVGGDGAEVSPSADGVHPGDPPPTAFLGGLNYGPSIRMGALHSVTDHAVNEAVFRAMRSYPAVSGQVHRSPELAAWNHEMTGGNPFHVLPIGLAFVGLLFARRGGWPTSPVAGFPALVGLFLISFSGASTPSSARYELGFFHLNADHRRGDYRLAPRADCLGCPVLLYAGLTSD
jgi:hypothetical protein